MWLEVALVGDEHAVEVFVDGQLAVEDVDLLRGRVDRVPDFGQEVEDDRQRLRSERVRGLDNDPGPHDRAALEFEGEAGRAHVRVAQTGELVQAHEVGRLLHAAERVRALHAAETLADAVRVQRDRQRDVVVRHGHPREAAHLLLAVRHGPAQRGDADLLGALSARDRPLELDLPFEVLREVHLHLREAFDCVQVVDLRRDHVRDFELQQPVFRSFDFVRHEFDQQIDFLVQDIEP